MTILRAVTPKPGGWFFFVDPDCHADSQPIFWRPELFARTVILIASPGRTADGLVFAPQMWPGECIIRPGAEGIYIFLSDKTEDHYLWLPGPPDANARLAACIPLDESMAVRTQAALQFWRFLRSGSEHDPPAASTQRTRREIALLRALDGHLEGASYRTLAQTLFGAKRLATEHWKTSSLRDTTIRLVRGGLALMRGGYKKLLGQDRSRR